MAYRAARLTSILIAAMLMMAAPAYAATYKWVDKNGKVHYSQTPPADGQFETIRDPHPVKEAPAAPADQQKNSETAPAAQQAPAADQESPQEACSKAKDRLAALENNARRLLVKQSDGTMHQLSEEERQSYIKDTTAQIAAVCK